MYILCETSVQDMSVKTLHLLIYGRVQGVLFRDSMRREAHAHGVTGWVRNRSEGTVEAVIQGDPVAVDTIVRWSHCGPTYAQVERVEINAFTGTYSGFDITG